MHKKIYFLLLALVGLVGLFLFTQINRAREIKVIRNPIPLISGATLPIPASESEQIYGNPGAPVTITEFMDLGCAKCLALHLAIKDFVSKNPLKIRLIWKDAIQPKILAQDSTLAHQAAFCAGNPDFAKASTGKENKFWEFTDLAAQNKNNLSENGLKKIAESLKLDTAKWWQCAQSPEAKQAIESSTQMAGQLGIKYLPAIFANNKLINTDAEINIQEMLEEFSRE